MPEPIKAIPDQHRAATPYLAVHDANAAIEFYQQAFGATETLRLTDADGKIGHAQIRIGQACIMLADEHPEYNTSPKTLGGSAVTIHLYVQNVDTFVKRAVEAGAELVFPVQDQFYGDRSGRVIDPFGHVWIFATHIEDVTDEEMQKRFEELCKSSPDS